MSKKVITYSLLLLFFSFSSFGKSELVGKISKEEILNNFPNWKDAYDSYSPKPDSIEKLKSIDYEVQIEIFLGTWCPDSVQHVSSYFKIMELADNPQFLTSYIGLPRDKESRKQFIQGKNIIRIPTFIITINGQEKGRIIETPEKSVEEDLVSIL